MTSEEKVLAEIKENIGTLFNKIAEFKVTEEEREKFEEQKAEYKLLIDDYKRHKEALIKRYGDRF